MEAETEDLPRQTHWLKLLVMGMSGFLMLAAMILVGVGVMRLGGKAPDVGQADVAEFAPVSLPLPAGCRIGQMRNAGERLILSVDGRDECRRILVLDLRSGRVLGQIDFPEQ